ncbi:MAG: hypothetical protein KIT74_00530 [Fimbriimonadales bacterium]|nr:hypothetical protein [Fimbriimonadales bacterium]
MTRVLVGLVGLLPALAWAEVYLHDVWIEGDGAVLLKDMGALCQLPTFKSEGPYTNNSFGVVGSKSLRYRFGFRNGGGSSETLYGVQLSVNCQGLASGSLTTDVTVQPSQTTYIDVDVGPFPIIVAKSAPMINVIANGQQMFLFEQASHSLYVLLDHPVAPMEHPWVQLLELGLRYANYESTEFQFKVKTSRNMNADGALYEYNPQNQWYADDLAPILEYNLTGLFNYLGLGQQALMNCGDVAGLLRAIWLCHGFPSATPRMSDSLERTFVTQLIQPIGEWSWSHRIWDWHMANIEPNSMSTFDACVRFLYHTSGAPWFDISTGWALPDYWQTPNHCGLVLDGDVLTNGYQQSEIAVALAVFTYI